jgi:hypothetical protein
MTCNIEPTGVKESIAKYLGRVAMIYNDFKRSEDRGNLKLVPLVQRAAYLAIRYRCLKEYQQELSQIDEKVAKSERKIIIIKYRFLSFRFCNFLVDLTEFLLFFFCPDRAYCFSHNEKI